MNDSEFKKELEHLINRCSMENGSDTPDFILAKYLYKCLENFNEASNKKKDFFKKQFRVVYKNPIAPLKFLTSDIVAEKFYTTDSGSTIIFMDANNNNVAMFKHVLRVTES